MENSKRVTNSSIINPVNGIFTLLQVRSLMIQNVCAYNNTQPASYWKKKLSKILLCNVGPQERLYFDRLLSFARDAERKKLAERQSKEAEA